MRISVDPSDRGYSNWRPELAGHVRAFLNGRKIEDVVTADEEEGTVIRHKRTADGFLVVDLTRTEVVCETLEGSVRIEIDPEYA